MNTSYSLKQAFDMKKDNEDQKMLTKDYNFINFELEEDSEEEEEDFLDTLEEYDPDGYD